MIMNDKSITSNNTNPTDPNREYNFLESPIYQDAFKRTLKLLQKYPAEKIDTAPSERRCETLGHLIPLVRANCDGFQDALNVHKSATR